MPAAFTTLQTGQNLTLDGLDPGISFILTRGFKVPGLACACYYYEVSIVLLCNRKRSLEMSPHGFGLLVSLYFFIGIFLPVL